MYQSAWYRRQISPTWLYGRSVSTLSSCSRFLGVRPGRQTYTRQTHRIPNLLHVLICTYTHITSKVIPRSNINRTSHFPHSAASHRYAQLQAPRSLHLYHYCTNAIPLLLEPFYWICYQSPASTLLMGQGQVFRKRLG